MGAKQSTPKSLCPDAECECESEVPRVKAACDSAASKAIGTTLTGATSSLIGKTNSDLFINKYQELTGHIFQPELIDGEKNKWHDYAKETPLGFRNLEGFDKNCLPCDCVGAANNVIKNCQDTSNLIPSEIQKIISDGGNVMSKNTQTSINGLFSAQEPPIDPSWAYKYHPNILITEKITEEIAEERKEIMTNMKEGYTGVSKFTTDALDARHGLFKNTTAFLQNCTSNSYVSIKPFIYEEKNNLDYLYNYYVTFLKDYESLNLHKESVRKIIYNKIDELEKIQTKIDSYKTNIHVDNRKYNYQTNNYDFYSNIRFYLLIIYYSLFIIYLIFSNFISLKQYNNKKILIVLFIYLIIPVILGYLINLTYEGYIYFLEYNNYKEDTKSYVDIVNGK